MKLRSPVGSKGFVLPLTMLVVISLLILVIGLIAVLSLERKTARSYSDATRAGMALQSGLSDALSTISEVASRDDTLVFRLEDPITPIKTDASISREQFFTYGSVYNTSSNSWRVIPLFSGAMETSPSPSASRPNSPDPTPLLTALSTSIGNNEIKTISRLADTDFNIPRAKWVQLPQSNADYKIRYAWWVEDLGGKLDGRTVGTQTRNKGLSTTELGLFTLFNTTSNTDTSTTEDPLIAKRDKYRTAASSRLILSATDSKKIEPFLTYSPAPAVTPVIPPLTIPQGFGYADAGKPAMDLNAAVAAKDVSGIAAKISNNLTKFTDRKGGFPATENYVKTIAASIIDYADSDSDATTGTGYRGVDSYPFVNELYDRYEWTGTSDGNVHIKVSTYAEFWNPSQQSITGRIEFENQNKNEITIAPTGVRYFTPVTYLLPSLSLLPNGFNVVFLGEKTYDFAVGAFPPSQPTFTTTETSNFQLKWNGALVDTARGNIQRQNGTLNPFERKWKGNGSPAQSISEGQAGDPRASYYINTFVFANTYKESTSWGGRCQKRGVPDPDHNDVKVSRWPDRGNDSTAGTNAGSDATLPTALIYPANQPTMAPACISNAGSYYSLGEIGNVFDPSQWKNIEVKNSNLAGSSSAGGGYTLAIGRPEYAQFDTEGQRAAQLIDLFYVKPVSGTVVPSAKINVNTAPRDVLRTLIAGIALTDDPVQGTIYPPKTTKVGDIFAEAVIATRKYAPLRGLSDLALVRKNWAQARNYTTPDANTEPFFGSRVSYPSPPPDTWNDVGREELFKKVINLVSFQGKSFRIVVAGEALNKSGNVLAHTAKEMNVMFESERDSLGNLVPNGKITIRKLYEKVL